jgi:pimeloyl-ACP methyl ester carboxylesterase
MWAGFSDEVKREIIQQGFWLRPSPYDLIGYKITKALIEDGSKHQILDAPIRVNCPVHIIAGEKDEDVPLSHIEKVQNALSEEELTVSIIKNGDHRLSSPQDLEFLRTSLLTLI